MTFSFLTSFSQNPPDTVKIGDSLLIYQSDTPDMSLTIYPENDGITYNQYVGETFAGYDRANGWRKDSINGGFGKGIYSNPYIEKYRQCFEKKTYDGKFIFYRYELGKKYNGKISDTVELYSYTKSFHGDYYLGESFKVVFNVNCLNGLLQGQSTLTTLKDNKLIAKCNFDNGEIVGECVSWDLATNEETRVIYEKGNHHWTKYTVIDKDGKIIEQREK